MLEQYLDMNAPLNEAVRQPYCPMHEGFTSGFVVTRTPSGWVMYCHFCGQKRFVRHKKLSPKRTLERLQRRKEPENLVVKGVTLPSDFILEIPMSGLRWLYKYRVTRAEMLRYRFGYSESRERLIMPVFSEGRVVYWQGRNLAAEGQLRPKYINVRSARDGVWFRTLDDYPDKPVVLVEDIISALNVARAGYNAIALLGCHVPEKLLAFLAERKYHRVIVWLDPDKRAESLGIVQRCRLYGIKATCVLTAHKDPKEYLSHEVHKYISGD